MNTLRFSNARSILFAACLVAGGGNSSLVCHLILGSTPACAGGWSWKLPPGMVKLDSGKRNNVFYVGEPVVFNITGAAVRYEVRGYDGEIVDRGQTADATTINVKAPGWYKLYIYKQHDTRLDGPLLVAPPKAPVDAGPDAGPVLQGTEKEDIKKAQDDAERRVWGDIVGGTTFCIFRKNANFPALPAQNVVGGNYYPSMDQVMRGVTGMGPQRHFVADAAKPDEAIKKLEADFAIDKVMYLPFDPIRKRSLMIAFPNGTKGKEAGVRQIVEHFKGLVGYYEPRNEPNYGASGKDFAEKEMKPFFDAVRAADPDAKVMGPGTVSIGPQLLPWIEDFLKAGGGDMFDVFSFHIYNGVNGDLWLARTSLDNLNVLLKKYNIDKKEKWQTEQGYMSAVYGSYQPRLQGRWTMVEMMAFEQYGIPKEHNHLWYDKSHGFWDVPTWWENEDGSLNPAAPLMRVWSEELFGTKFVKAFDFGDPGNKLTIGSLFGGPGKWVAAFQSAGSTDGHVELNVKGGTALKVVSAFGVENTVPVRAGHATVEVPELPVYIELATGQSIDVAPTAWGPNLARAAGVTAQSSVPVDPDPKKAALNPIEKITNGVLENWYYAQKPDTGPWAAVGPTFPATVDINLPTAQSISRVVIYAAPPWQMQSTLLDYELQYDDNGEWKTIGRIKEPTRTFRVYTPPVRCSTDTFFSDRFIFQHSFKPVTTSKIRLLVHDTTLGGGATKAVPDAGGQSWGVPVLMLREVEIYGK